MVGTIFGKGQEFGGAEAGVCVAAKVSTVLTGVSTVVARLSTVVAGAGFCVVAELRTVVAKQVQTSVSCQWSKETSMFSVYIGICLRSRV